MNGQFSAIAPALGYYYQVRYALWRLLHDGRDNPDVALSIERLDDIAFEERGTPLELIQTKHHVERVASLTDGSPDLWKTIRVWSAAVAEGSVPTGEVVRTLVTTSCAPPNSAACYLHPPGSLCRNADAALNILCDTATKSRSSEGEAAYKAYQAFLKLSNSQQRSLLDSVQILDSAATITDLEDKIHQELWLMAHQEHLPAIQERLEGWWMRTVVNHLMKGATGVIASRDLRDALVDILDQFRSDNLPVDFVDPSAFPVDLSACNDRMFVSQLRLINVRDPRIFLAIQDFYAASRQRSKWVREDLLLIQELERYDHKLADEWEHEYERHREECEDSPSDNTMRDAGRELYKWAMNQSLLIRPRVT